VLTFESSQEFGSFSAELQSAFKAVVDEEFAAAQEKAGISIAVFSGGLLWRYALGEASSTTNMTTSTPIPIGSTSKTFVSALVLTQIAEGLYELTDSLEQVLSGHPAYESFDKTRINPDVTVEEMLAMRSGLAEFNDNREGTRGFFSNATWEPADNVNLVQSSFAEAGAFDYNDTNLVLLGLVAEFHGSGNLNNLYSQVFFEPLGIAAVLPPQDVVPSDTALPYGDLVPHAEGFGNIIDAAPYDFDHYWFGQGRLRWPCCGLITTAENLARWGYELYSSNGAAVPESARMKLFDALLTDPVFYQGLMQNYGYFTTQRTYVLPSSATVTTVGHPGAGGGYSTLLRYSPELDLVVVLLANSLLQVAGTCGSIEGQRDVRHCLAARIFAAYTE
jgi:CubicO group peptidase (beta-lactamase class C family)